MNALRTYLILSLIVFFISCNEEVDDPIPISLTLEKNELKANGFSQTEVTASIDNDSGEDFRQITFTTTSGSFTNGTQTIVVRAITQEENDEVATAQTLLTVGNIPGDHIITASHGPQNELGVREELVLLPVEAEEIFNFTVEPVAGVLANGFTPITLTFELEESTALSRFNSVTFETNGLASFANALTSDNPFQVAEPLSTSEINTRLIVGQEVGDLVVRAILTSSDPSISFTSAPTTVPLGEAEAGGLTIGLSTVFIDSVGQIIAVSASLFRNNNPGMVSIGTEVEFSSLIVGSSNNQEAGTFEPRLALTNSDQVASTVFIYSASLTSGATIQISAQSPPNSAVSDTRVLTIK